MRSAVPRHRDGRLLFNGSFFDAPAAPPGPHAVRTRPNVLVVEAPDPHTPVRLNGLDRPRLRPKVQKGAPDHPGGTRQLDGLIPALGPGMRAARPGTADKGGGDLLRGLAGHVVVERAQLPQAFLGGLAHTARNTLGSVRLAPHSAARGTPPRLPVVHIADQSPLPRRPHTPDAFDEVCMRIHSTFHRGWGKHEKCMTLAAKAQNSSDLGF